MHCIILVELLSHYWWILFINNYGVNDVLGVEGEGFDLFGDWCEVVRVVSYGYDS